MSESTRANPPCFRECKRAKIGGEKFTFNESLRGVRRVGEKMFRCGSVVTMITDGRIMMVNPFMVGSEDLLLVIL